MFVAQATTIMASLNGVDSNGVSQEVIDRVGQFREWHVHLTDDDAIHEESYMFTFQMEVSQRDAEYIVECLRVLLQEQRISKRTALCLFHDEISDEAIVVFCGFLRQTPCRLQALYLWCLPPRQVRRLLEALHTNTSVKDLLIYGLNDDQGTSWIVDLLRHKRDFQQLHLCECCVRFPQIIPLLRGQPKLQELGFNGGRSNGGLLLFNDPAFTQLFVDNILLSPSTTLKKLRIQNCGVAIHNRPLMSGFHKNTTLVELTSDHEDAATRLFINPILRRNLYLGNVHGMLGTRTTTIPPTSLTLPTAGAVGEEIVVPTTIPPPCGLWATILTKVGQGTQGASPVFTILRDRLATWMEPSPRYENQNELEQQDADYQHASPLQPETASTTNHADSAEGLYATRLDDGELVIAPLLVQNMDDSVTSPIAVSTDCSERFQSGVCDSSSRVVTVASATTTKKSPTTVDPTSSSATVTEAQRSLVLHKKRAAVSTADKNMTGSKIPKSDML